LIDQEIFDCATVEVKIILWARILPNSWNYVKLHSVSDVVSQYDMTVHQCGVSVAPANCGFQVLGLSQALRLSDF